MPHGTAGIPIWLLIEEHPEPVSLPVHLHFAALESPALIFGFGFLRQFLNPFLGLPDHSAVIGQGEAFIGFGIRPPVSGHGRFQFLDLPLRQKRTAVQSLIFPVVGVDRFHLLLILLQPLQLDLQFLHGLRVIGADAALARAADLVQEVLDLLPLLHIGIGGPVLLFLFPHREVAPPSHQDGRHTGGDLVAPVDILRQPAGVGVQQAVNPLVVDGVHLAFLLFRDADCLIYRPAVFRCGAALHIVEIAVHLIGPPGQLLIDGIIIHTHAACFSPASIRSTARRAYSSLISMPVAA